MKLAIIFGLILFLISELVCASTLDGYDRLALTGENYMRDTLSRSENHRDTRGTVSCCSIHRLPQNT